MPVGVLINTGAIFLGGVIGGLFGDKFSERFKEQLNLIFGLCSMAMGVSAIGLMKYMPAVIFAVIIGTILGFIFNLGELIYRGCAVLQKIMTKIIPGKSNNMSEIESLSLLITAIVLFCASGTGIYGSLEEGMTGNASLLITKSILDFFTALIFACNLGYIVSLIAIPQLIIFSSLYFIANLIIPLTTPDMIADFKACGGILMLATGFRIIKVKMFPVADMIPAMLIVMPISWFWVNVILHII